VFGFVTSSTAKSETMGTALGQKEAYNTILFGPKLYKRSTQNRKAQFVIYSSATHIHMVHIHRAETTQQGTQTIQKERKKRYKGRQRTKGKAAYKQENMSILREIYRLKKQW